jgi:hypothetical protein
MSQKQKLPKPIQKLSPFLLGVILGLTVILIITLAVRREAAEQFVSIDNRVSVGPMTYGLSNGKAIKRTDDAVNDLRSFLKEAAQKDTSQNCVSYYSVIRASTDEKQVLLGYGCDAPSARMFAVNNAGTWRTISPTNQFDDLGIPMCSHVNEHSIDKSIAPVCVTTEGDAATYVVRL